MSWLKKTIKKVGKSLEKPFTSTFDIATGGQFSKLTGLDSYFKNYRKELMLADLAALGGAGAAAAFGGAGAAAAGSQAWLPSSASQAAKLGVPYVGGLSAGSAGSASSGLGSIFGGSFLGGLINTGLGTVGSMLTARDQLSGQQKLQDDAFSKNVQMWNMQNEYNSPLKQMERYQAAGLNPNLIYGNGVSSAGNASGAPEYEPAHYKGIDLNSIMAFQSMANMMQQNELLAQQTELAKIQAVAASVSAEYAPLLKAAELDGVGAQNENTRAHTRQTNAQTDAIGNTYTPWQIGLYTKSIPDALKKVYRAFRDSLPSESEFARRRALYNKYGRNWRKYY